VLLSCDVKEKSTLATRREPMTKLLWHSNSPLAPTGYGSQTALFAPLLGESYDLAVSAFYGLEGSRIRWNGIPIYPGLGGEFGSPYLADHAKRGGLVFTLLDVWVLNPNDMARMDVACWTPVDHDPVPPAVVRFFQQSGSVPVAMSKFGEGQLEAAGLEPLYVPHGVDVDAYRPYDKRESRKLAGVPQDAFLVGMVAANKGRPSRKGFQQAFEAFRLLSERHDDAYLYLHTTANPNLVPDGEDIPGLLDSLQIRPDRVLLADQYRMLFDPFSPQAMARIYSTFDVLLNASMGEGFGIPILEAQACGVPVVVTDFSAMSELCGAGWMVKGRPWWTAQKSWQAVPDVGEIAQALNDCRGLAKSHRKALSDKARRFALQYAAPKVLADHMLPALEKAQERFGERKPLEVVPRGVKVAA
jgi:glycosyltransferase involved in cell wall biosynthesis